MKAFADMGRGCQKTGEIVNIIYGCPTCPIGSLVTADLDYYMGIRRSLINELESFIFIRPLWCRNTLSRNRMAINKIILFIALFFVGRSGLLGFLTFKKIS